MRDVKRKLSIANGTLSAEYGALVNKKIRTRYSLSEELAILRKRDEAPDDFAAYNAFAEACKKEAKREIFGEEVEA